MGVLDKVHPFLSLADASLGGGTVIEVEGGFVRVIWQSDVDGLKFWTIGRRTADTPASDTLRVRGIPFPYTMMKGDWGFDWKVVRLSADAWAGLIRRWHVHESIRPFIPLTGWEIRGRMLVASRGEQVFGIKLNGTVLLESRIDDGGIKWFECWEFRSNGERQRYTDPKLLRTEG